MAILMAATHPERVSSLVLYGSYAKRTRGPDYPWAQAEEEPRRLHRAAGLGVGLGGRLPDALPVRRRGDAAVVGPADARGGDAVDRPRADGHELPRRRPRRAPLGAGAHARPAPPGRPRLPRRGGPLPRRAHPRRAARRALRRGPLRRGDPDQILDPIERFLHRTPRQSLARPPSPPSSGRPGHAPT